MRPQAAVRSGAHKVIHIVRHGQAAHNVRAEPARANGCSYEASENYLSLSLKLSLSLSLSLAISHMAPAVSRRGLRWLTRATPLPAALSGIFGADAPGRCL